MGIYGQDWASYQSATPDTSGLSFAFVKVTQGLSYINPIWHTQRDHAKANGLVWGAYHYPYMGNSPQAEADYFLSQVAWKPGDLVVLDWEGYDKANSGVPKATQAAYKDAWLKYVKAKLPNNRVGMYANTDYWRNVDRSGYYGDFLWIATANRNPGDPGIQANWLFHQYSDAGGLDRDYCHLNSTAALRSWALGNQPQPEDDMPLTPADAVTVWGYSHGDKPDVHQTLANAASQATAAAAGVNALSAKVDKLASPALSDAQLQTLADKLANSPTFVSALSAGLAADIAARLAN
ncbi:glycoside hydrolase family 25 protein [Streptomyces xanthochromogenes]|uniref:glycoside hydrolase family 25 protein n=1 Tax=Streptomyces xanthochromogenes TaxID=67384 RepID=UPI003818E5FA